VDTSSIVLTIHHSESAKCSPYEGRKICRDGSHWLVTVKGMDYKDERTPELKAALSGALATSPGLRALIRADRMAPFGHVLKTMTACAEVGYAKVDWCTRSFRDDQDAVAAGRPLPLDERIEVWSRDADPADAASVQESINRIAQGLPPKEIWVLLRQDAKGVLLRTAADRQAADDTELFALVDAKAEARRKAGRSEAVVTAVAPDVRFQEVYRIVAIGLEKKLRFELVSPPEPGPGK
jgi:hypothetical protein